jgi:hypothetical protein
MRLLRGSHSQKARQEAATPQLHPRAVALARWKPPAAAAVLPHSSLPAAGGLLTAVRLHPMRNATPFGSTVRTRRVCRLITTKNEDESNAMRVVSDWECDSVPPVQPHCGAAQHSKAAAVHSLHVTVGMLFSPSRHTALPHHSSTHLIPRVKEIPKFASQKAQQPAASAGALPSTELCTTVAMRCRSERCGAGVISRTHSLCVEGFFLGSFSLPAANVSDVASLCEKVSRRIKQSRATLRCEGATCEDVKSGTQSDSLCSFSACGLMCSLQSFGSASAQAGIRAHATVAPLLRCASSSLRHCQPQPVPHSCRCFATSAENGNGSDKSALLPQRTTEVVYGQS